MAKPVKKKANGGDTASYAIKGLDRAAWERFVSKAHGEGRSVKWLFLHFIKRYSNGEYPISDQQ